MAAFSYYTAIITLLWSLMLSSVICNIRTHTCNEHDMSTLLNFKQGVVDPSGRLSSWLPQSDCCRWKGVHCDDITGRVTGLNLPCHIVLPAYGDIDKSHCLTGELDILPLLDLEFLTFLNLSNNDFKTIQFDYSTHNPACNNFSRDTTFHRCGNSSNLNYLDLSHNSDLLIDNLNSQIVSPFFSFQYLDLSGINLRKENDWIQSLAMLPSLSELHLVSCGLVNIHPSLQYVNFTSLKVLIVDENDFESEFPKWIFNLSSEISHIHLSENHLHGQLPKGVTNLRSLKSLHLSNNNLEGSIPDWLGQLEQLQQLDLSYNSFSGPIPASLGNLSSLIELNLISNNLNGNLPESLGKLINLKLFGIRDNFLSGNISERYFHSLSKLENLAMGSPMLIFDFDPNWVPPFQLQIISFKYVVPRLPTWLYTQSSLRALSIGCSRVSFEPVEQLWKFATQLDFFSLYNNSVNADMSNVLLNSKIVWLDENNLSGSVPQVSPNVTFLNLRDNFLSGSISPLLCHKTKEKNKLELLNIENNSLSGELPNCWKNWKSLLFVSLSDNNLTGKIPDSLGSLSSLISLDLSRNKLSGEVPLSLRNCKSLWILNLAENMLSGAISGWMDPNLKALQLRSNKFGGNIHSEICQLQSLMILDVSNNKLLGPIPNCLHNMTSMISNYASFDEFSIRVHVMNDTMIFTYNLMLLIKNLELYYTNSMYVVDLSSNNLTGTLPLELFMLIRLQSLNLSHNQLMGPIPQQIGNLTQLESIDLSSNWFSGQIPQSMSGLSFLDFLNLSFNNFMGEIPSGTQLQSFTNFSYMGNPELCGPPLTKSCTQGEEKNNTIPIAEDNDEEALIQSWFYMGLGIGFATGYCGVLCVILFNKSFRHAYFKFLSNMSTMVLLKMDVAYWKLRNCYSRN